jgi:hypothetical protein
MISSLPDGGSAALMNASDAINPAPFIGCTLPGRQRKGTILRFKMSPSLLRKHNRYTPLSGFNLFVA